MLGRVVLQIRIPSWPEMVKQVIPHTVCVICRGLMGLCLNPEYVTEHPQQHLQQSTQTVEPIMLYSSLGLLVRSAVWRWVSFSAWTFCLPFEPFDFSESHLWYSSSRALMETYDKSGLFKLYIRLLYECVFGLA